MNEVTAKNEDPNNGENRWLRDGASLAQILLAIVAILTYIFTVRPIYQKERLAEEVAQIELRIIEQSEK